MFLRAVCAASIAIALVACSGDGGSSPDAPDPIDAQEIDAFVIPLLRNPVTLTDEELAPQAARLLGEGGAVNCNRCHALTRDRLRGWGCRT